MKTLKLDHSLQPTPQKTVATFILLLAILCLLFCVYLFQQSTTILSGLQKEKDAINHGHSGVSVVTMSEREKTELNAVNTAIDEIVKPWTQLFFALEEARLNQINVMSVEPNINTKTVQITAITHPIENILAFMTELKKHTVFDSVNLLSTELVSIDGKDAIKFELMVMW